MYFSPTLDLLSSGLLGASVLCIVFVTLVYILRIKKVVDYRDKADSERPDKPDSDYQPASVVIYSQGDAENLQEVLQAVLSQDYPAAFEIIVVNEGESADVRDVVSMLRYSHPNLYLTFTPEGVVNLSRKKLALTLGIKAARYNTVVLTTTAVTISSSLWLRRMMYNFNQGSSTEIVLGYACIDPEEDTSFGARFRAFDYVADSVRWLSAAIVGKPFRGTEYNIAYTKDIFLRNKGFARSLNLHYGDDDIFISEIATGDNTTVELSEDSLVYLRNGNQPRMYSERVFRRFFTESFIRHRPRFLFPLTGWSQVIALACLVAAAILGLPNLFASVIALVLFLAMCFVDIFFWRKACEALKSRELLLSIPLFSIYYPIKKLFQRIQNRLSKQKKYTWD